MITDKVSDRFKRNLAASIVNGLIMIVVGLFIYLFPDLTKRIISGIIGGLLVLTSVFLISKYINRKGAKLYSYNLLFGLIFLCLGTIMIIFPNLVFNNLVIFLGLYLILLGAVKISYGIWFKVGSDDSWLITFTVGIILILFGLILISNPFETILTITQVIGLFLILTGVIEVVNNILVYKKTKDITKIFW